jgi:predicted RNA-binding protein with PIN domain
MAIHIIVDGYNLIRQSSELAELDRQNLQLGRDALIDQLVAYKKIKAHKITVVFDGSDAPSLYGPRDRVKGIAIRYSQGGERADDVIARMARREKGKALVVSSDREIMAAAESAGATAMESPAFADKLAISQLMALKSDGESVDSSGWVPTTRKKGPSRRLPKRKRKAMARIKKL